MRTLNTYRLRILQEVAARGTISAAAEALHLTGPAVSHQVTMLERELGVALLERTPRSVRLTEAGRVLVGRAPAIMAECEAAVAEMKTFADEVRGVVRVSMSEVPYELHVRMVSRLRERHPALEVVLTSTPPDEALAALRVGELDIVISMEWEARRAVASPGTTRYDLLTEPYGVVLPPDHRLASEDGPLRLRDLADERWCLLREPRFREVLEREMRSAGFEPQLAFEGSNSFGLAASCAARLGVAIVPLGMEVVLPGVVVRPLDEPALTRHIFTLVRAGSEQSPAIRTVLDAMTQGAADAIRRGVGSLSAPDGAPA